MEETLDDGTTRWVGRIVALVTLGDTPEVYRNQFVEVIFRAVDQVAGGRVNARTG